ncbi:MAG: hypothetical protein AAGC60_01615 [Acidobacteriota bacterium]
MATNERKDSSAQAAANDPPDNDYPKTGHNVFGRGVLFETKMTDPWGGTLHMTVSVDPVLPKDSWNASADSERTLDTPMTLHPMAEAPQRKRELQATGRAG